jgi:hypothetical protein
MLEIFDLTAGEAGPLEVWQDDRVHVWAVGSGARMLPAIAGRLECGFHLRSGLVQLGDDWLEGPALGVLPPGDVPRFETMHGPVKMLVWVLHDSPAAVSRNHRPTVLRPADLVSPRTITAANSIVHWLPRSTHSDRRTLAGAPSLALHLGQAPVPMVSGDELRPLAANHGMITDDVVTLRVVPGSGPIIAVERIVPPH